MTIDLSNLEELSGGSNEFMLEILGVFLKETPPNIVLLRQHVAAKEYQQVEFLAHKMKSAIGLLGITEAEEAAKKVEIIAKSGSTAGVDELIDQLEAGCNTAMDELQQMAVKYQ